MTEPSPILPDPLDGLLRPPLSDEAEEPLRRRLLEQTTRALRRRRRLRIVVWAAGLAACYAAGVLTLFWLAPRPTQVIEVVKPQAPPGATPTPPAPTPNTPPATPASAVALEWKAFDADKPRPDLYRQAGDQYLQGDDPASALRCYGKSLDDAADKDLTISPDDDYLLMLVKEARLKEKDHAKRGG